MSGTDSLSPPPLQERLSLPSNLQRLQDVAILLLLFSLLAYRLATLRELISTVALLCESVFTFAWLLNVNARWNPVAYRTHPQRLSKRLGDLPAVDMFVTTADPTLEPPMMTANTVLSLLAVDYPARLLACYVSDDGGSPITCHALREAAKFARLWVPFCKRHDVQVRAPSVYFSTRPESAAATPSSDFIRDWKRVKREYVELTRKIEGAAKNHGSNDPMDDELPEFSGGERGNHASIIKVLSENKGEDDVPHLIYVAREKRPKHPHHFKAGAMNVLTRVSGVMTNAPIMLNVDCDMYASNPQVVLHAVCLLLGFDSEASSGYVQAPQQFHGALKDDPFGNQLVVIQKKCGDGIAGIQGPFYAGTGCFHRRKVIYGSSNECDNLNDKLSYDQLQRTYGNSREVMESASEITLKKTLGFPIKSDPSSRIAAAMEVAACTYEFNTSWGKEIGWLYGSVAEDILTGTQIHARGWRSVYLTPDPPAFLGSAPTGGPASLTQYKRWATGLFEILLDKCGPIHATLYKKLSFRQCLAYLVIIIWAPASVFEFIYALLPAYCFLTNSAFLPKASSPQFLVPAAIFITYNLSTIADYLQCGLTVRAWWNNQRMSRISSATALLFGFLSVLLKLLGLSETMFEVTKKDQNNSIDNAGTGAGADVDPGRFTFDSSPLFVPGMALVLVHIAALAAGAVHLLGGREHRWGLGEFVCSSWVVLSFGPFVRGLFGKGSHGVPWSIIWKAAGLAWIFVQVCWLGRAN